MRPTRRAAVAAVMLAGCWTAAPLVASALVYAQPAPPAPAPPAPAETQSELKTTIDANGSYAVGTDIAPGNYQSAGPVDDGACYWKRTSGDELLDNALTKKPAFVQILPTDTTFSTSDCQVWQLTDAPPPPQPAPGDLLGQLTGLIGSGIFAGGPP